MIASALREPSLEVGVLPVGPRQFRRHGVDGWLSFGPRF